MRCVWKVLFALLLLFGLHLLDAQSLSGQLHAEDGLEVAVIERSESVSFQDEIAPLLRKNCLACHNESETEGELVMETVESLLEGGDSGPAIIAGDGEESLLFQLASHRTEPIMPPVDNDVGAKPLSAEALGLLKRWIDEGAKDEEEAAPDVIEWKQIPSHYAPVHALSLSPDGRWLAAGRGNQAILYSVPAKQEFGQLIDPAIAETHPDCAHLDIVQSIAWSPDQSTLVTGGYRCIKVWQRADVTLADAKLREEDLALAGDEAGDTTKAIVVSADKTRLVLLRDDSGVTSVRLLELPGRKLLKEWKPTDLTTDEQQQIARELALKKEQLRVAEEDVGVARGRRDGEVKNAEKSKQDLSKAKEELTKGQDAFTKAEEQAAAKLQALQDAQQNADEVKAKVAELDAELKAAEEPQKSELQQQRQKQQAEFEKLTEDVKKKQAESDKAATEAKKKRQQFEGKEKVVKLSEEAIERSERAVKLREEELSTAESVAAAMKADVKQTEEGADAAKQKLQESAATFTGVDLGSDGSTFLIATDGHIARFTLADGELLDIASGRAAGDWTLVRVIGDEGDSALFADRVTALAFSHDGKILATGGGEPSRSGQIHLWNTADWSQMGQIAEAHSDVVYDLEFSPQGGLLASCGSDRMMKTIDVDQLSLVRNFEGHTGHVLGVTWRADGRTLASAGADKVVKVWDAKEGTQKKTISGFKSEITSVRFVGLNDRLVFSTGDGKVEARDSNGGSRAGFDGFRDYVHRVSCSLDGQVVAASGEDRVVRVWAADGKLMASFE